MTEPAPGSLLAFAERATADKRLDADGRIKPIAAQVMELADLARREIKSLDGREDSLLGERASIDGELAEIRAERVAWETIVAKMSAAPVAQPTVEKPAAKPRKPRKPRGLTAALNVQPDREEQRRASAHGNASTDNDRITREMVDQAADRMATGGEASGFAAPPEGETLEIPAHLDRKRLGLNPASVAEAMS